MLIGGPGGRSWQASVAGAGVLLLILQIALGALVRHHLIGYGLHLLVAGLAALAILVPAVAVSQDEGATAVLKRIAMLAIASLLVQLSLGVVVLFMILTGSANVNAWLFTTVAHVVAGTITLLAAASLAHALRAGEPANREPANPRVFRTAR
jgi:heme A synthase